MLVIRISLAVDDKRLVGAGNFAREFPMDRVILEKVGKDGRFCPRIDGNDLEVIVPEGSPDEISSDAAEPFTAHLHPCVYLLFNIGASGAGGLQEDWIFGLSARPGPPREWPASSEHSGNRILLNSPGSVVNLFLPDPSGRRRTPFSPLTGCRCFYRDYL